MSTTVRLITIDGEERIVMLSALRNLLGSLEANLAALRALMRDGQAQVTLNNGVPTLITLMTTDNAADNSAQTVLSLREFDVGISILIPVPASVRCRANSPSEAAQITTDVLSGKRAAPLGFTTEVSADDIEGLQLSIESYLPDRPQWLELADVLVTNVTERLLLGAPA